MARLAQRSAYVLLILGASTKGLRWEIQSLVRMKLHDKVLVIFPPLVSETLGVRWDEFNSVVKEYAIELSPLTYAPSSQFPLFAHFDSDWKCHVVFGRAGHYEDYKQALIQIINERQKTH